MENLQAAESSHGDRVPESFRDVHERFPVLCISPDQSDRGQYVHGPCDKSVQKYALFLPPEWKARRLPRQRWCGVRTETKAAGFFPLWGIRQCIVHKNGQNLCDALRIQRAVTVSRIHKGKLQEIPLKQPGFHIFHRHKAADHQGRHR